MANFEIPAEALIKKLQDELTQALTRAHVAEIAADQAQMRVAQLEIQAQVDAEVVGD